MDKFIKLLDLLRKDKPLSVHIAYMGGGEIHGAYVFWRKVIVDLLLRLKKIQMLMKS